MKGFFIALLAALLCLTGCSEGGDTEISGNGSDADNSQSPRIMLFTTYENWASGENHALSIYTNDGKCCTLYWYQYDASLFSDTDGQSSGDWGDPDPPDWVNAADSEDWYDRLCDLARNDDNSAEISELSANKCNLALRAVPSFAEWEDQPVKDYGETACDAGMTRLYGVYLDGNGTPQKTFIAEYGDYSQCRDSAAVRRFVKRFLGAAFK